MTPALEALTQAARDLEVLTDDLTRDIVHLEGHDHIELIRYFDDFRQAADRFSEAKKAITFLHDKLSRDMIPEAMRDAGVKTVTVVGVGRVSISHRYSCTMTDKDQGMAWLKNSGHGDLVIETVNSSTLAAFSKSLMQDEGKELPADLFKVGTSPYTSITKA
jgi:hypothetical protein